MLIGAIIGLILLVFVAVYESAEWNIRHTTSSTMLGAFLYGGIGAIIGYTVERLVA